MSRSTGRTGTASRFTASRVTVRSFAVALLSVGLVGGFHVAEHRQLRQASAEAAVQTRAQVAAMEELRQLVEENQSADMARWAAGKEAARVAAREAEAVVERVSRAEEAASRRSAQGRIPAAPAVPIPSSCDEFSGNRAIGCALLLDAGFGLDQMPCLDRLWTKESGWNHLARNGSSGAYGIPQALPGGKMSAYGADWETNPATQIRWGLSYIQGRYSTPCGAWQHSQNVGWY